MAESSLNNTLETYQQRVNKVIGKHLDALPEHAPKLKQAMKYCSLLGGKRIRPFLVYSIGKMLGVDLAKLDSCAAAIECIHAYSLVHDDLPAMDDDELRRGKPTVHIAYDEATAILAGDALQSLAFEMLCHDKSSLSATQQLEMLQVISKAAGYSGMCGGQAIDLDSTNQKISLDQLIQLHGLKTGALISCAVELALIASNADEAHKASLRIFAKNIGLAFQVQDDILDITSTTEELGKPQGSDTQANKSTFPSLLGLEKAKQTAEQLINDALSELDDLPYNSQIIEDLAQYLVARRV